MIHQERNHYQSHLPAIIGGIILIILGNLFLFYMRDQPISLPQELPYFEDFSALEKLNYRLIGDGSWTIEEEQLIQQDPTQADIVAVIPGLELDAEQDYDFSANIGVLEGPKGGGLFFNIQNDRRMENSHMVRMGSAEGADYLVYGYFDDNQNFLAQGSIQIENVGPEFKLGVQVTNPNYSVSD